MGDVTISSTPLGGDGARLDPHGMAYSFSQKNNSGCVPRRQRADRPDARFASPHHHSTIVSISSESWSAQDKRKSGYWPNFGSSGLVLKRWGGLLRNISLQALAALADHESEPPYRVAVKVKEPCGGTDRHSFRQRAD